MIINLTFSVLDLQGGPNWVGNFVDSPIIANTTSGDIFYKEPMVTFLLFSFFFFFFFFFFFTEFLF